MGSLVVVDGLIVAVCPGARVGTTGRRRGSVDWRSAPIPSVRYSPSPKSDDAFDASTGPVRRSTRPPRQRGELPAGSSYGVGGQSAQSIDLSSQAPPTRGAILKRRDVLAALTLPTHVAGVYRDAVLTWGECGAYVAEARLAGASN
jgi:hypothetical protein